MPKVKITRIEDEGGCCALDFFDPLFPHWYEEIDGGYEICFWFDVAEVFISHREWNHVENLDVLELQKLDWNLWLLYKDRADWFRKLDRSKWI